MGQPTHRLWLVRYLLALLWSVPLPFLGAIAQTMPPATPQMSVGSLSTLQTAEQFIDALFGNDFQQAWTYLNPILQEEITPQALQQRQQAFLKRVGTYQNRVDAELDGNIVSIKVAFSNITDTLILIFDENGKITGVDFPANPNSLSIQSPR
ncbi:DUF3887 domain-containing protein [Parathermosynechococcus lividus]